MLKTIPVSDVRLGMFIERLEGKWLDHPFWRSRFVLSDEGRLRTLQNSRVELVVIDASKGLDVAEPETAECAADSNTVLQRLQRVKGQPSENAKLVRALRAPPPPLPAASLRRNAVRVQEFGKAKAVARRTEKKLETLFLAAKNGAALDTTAANRIVEDVFATIEREPYAFSGLMRCKQGTPDIYRHSLIVSALMISLARKMQLSFEQVLTAGQAGLLMDIGHAYLTPNTPAEQHVILGYEVLKAADNLAEEVLSVCLKHHERIDGSGAPSGLVEREIDEYAQMASICDAFAAMGATGDETVVADPAEAIDYLVGCPTKFSAEIVERFVEAVGVYPIGSFVEMQSGHVAMVVFGDAEGTDRPTVRTFYDLSTGRQIRGENVDLRNCYGQDSIIGSYDPSALDLGDLSGVRERVLTAALKA